MGVLIVQFRIFVSLVTLASVTGCATVSPPDLSKIQGPLTQRTNLPASVSLEVTNAAEAEQQVKALLEQPLTPVSAMQVALLKSSALHAELAELGVAHAEVVEAGLISNPVFAVGALRPEGGGRWQLDFGLSQSLLDLLTRSLRKSVARAEYERVQLEVTERLTTALQEIQAAYYSTVAESHRAAILDVVAQAAEASSQLANRFYSAGNITELEYLREAAEATQRRLDADVAKAEARKARYAFATRLGLTHAVNIQLPTQLPDLPTERFDGTQLEEQALTQRLDLQILRESGRRYEQQLGLARSTGGVEDLELGVNAEREFDGAWNYGPELSVSLPIFHQGQARIAAATAELSRIDNRAKAMRVAIGNEIAQALASLQASRAKAERLRMLVIPQRERIVQLSLQRYNFMLAGVSEAMAAKQQEYEAYLTYVDSLNDYWQARSELAVAVGGGLPEPQAKPAPLPQPGAAVPSDHSAHGAGHSTEGMDHSMHGKDQDQPEKMEGMDHSQHKMDHSQHQTTPNAVPDNKPESAAPSNHEQHQQDGAQP